MFLRSFSREHTVTAVQVADMRASGREPYAYSFNRTHTAAQLQAQFGDLEPGQVIKLLSD